MDSKASSLLVADKVTKSYRLGDVTVAALTDIDLSVARGEFLAIAGSSGSGKTTLLNLFGCLDRPNGGRILIEGNDTALLGRRALAQLRSDKIGFIFQTFNLLPVLCAAENVEYPLVLQRVPAAERRSKVQTALEKVGLSKFAAHRPAQLSGGQRQRVAIARALVKSPSVILADEPTANLDKANAIAILDLMHGLNQTDGVTFVFSSHDPLILSRAHRCVELSDGRITPHAGSNRIS